MTTETEKIICDNCGGDAELCKCRSLTELDWLREINAELLEALKFLLACNGDPEINSGTANSAMEAAAATIAKAEGGGTK